LGTLPATRHQTRLTHARRNRFRRRTAKPKLIWKPRMGHASYTAGTAGFPDNLRSGFQRASYSRPLQNSRDSQSTLSWRLSRHDSNGPYSFNETANAEHAGRSRGHQLRILGRVVRRPRHRVRLFRPQETHGFRLCLLVRYRGIRPKCQDDCA